MTADLFEIFAGRWTLDRAIEGEKATLIGEAWFEPCGPTSLSYREMGRLSLADGHVLDTSRRYLYRRAGDAIEIDFDDGPDRGSLFVCLVFASPSPNEAQAVHHCGEDVYRVCYRLYPPNRFETEIGIVGPRKNYRLVSQYRRLP